MEINDKMSVVLLTFIPMTPTHHYISHLDINTYVYIYTK